MKVHSFVRLHRETDTELRFANPTLGGLVLAAIGGGLAWLGVRELDGAGIAWPLVAGGALFALFGCCGVLWRHEVTFDLMTRTYRGRRGFWPASRVLQGSLSELRCVALARRYGGSPNPDRDGDGSVEWTVTFEFAGWDGPLRVYTTRDERKAYAKLEHYARKLGVESVDRTGNGVTRRTAEHLDAAVEPPRDGAAVLAAPPTERMRFTDDGAGAEIALPPLGINGAPVFVFLFGSAFEALGMLAILASTHVIDVKFDGTPVVAWTLGGLFVLLGGFLAFGGIIGSLARETVREVRDGLQFSLAVGGWSYRHRFVAKRGVEEVALKPAATARTGDSRNDKRQEVVVRADTEVVRLGQSLTPEEQEWLCHTLRILSCRR